MSGLFAAYKEAFRVWLKRRTRPYSIEEAEEKRLFWAKAYALVSWSILGYFGYLAINQNITLPLRQDLPKNVATGVEFIKDQPVRFISFEGFKKVEDFSYTKEQMQELTKSKPKPKPEKPNPSAPSSDNSKTKP